MLFQVKNEVEYYDKERLGLWKICNKLTDDVC